MGLFSNKETYLGVDIGANGIKLVELHKTKGRPQLWTYGIADENLNLYSTAIEDQRIEEYSTILKELCKRAKITTKRATASLPVSSIFHTVLTMPKIDKKEILPVIKSEVAKMLDRPIEEMQIVHQIIPDGENSKYLRILVTAAPKSLVKFYSAIFVEAGLELQELETEAFALERSLVGKDKTTAIVVDIGAERTNFFIIDKGLPLTHRSAVVGGRLIDKILAMKLDVPIEMAANLKYDLSLNKNVIETDIFLPLVDSIIKEIEYSFDLFLHQAGNEGKHPEKIILTGGTAALPFIREAIQKKFSLKVFVGDPWARIVYQDGLRSILDSIGPRMSVSIGLAMRNIVKDEKTILQ